jgi:hypothetical protein
MSVEGKIKEGAGYIKEEMNEQIPRESEECPGGS